MGRRKRFPKEFKNVSFTGLADKGLAVGRDPEGQVIFAQGAVPGDVADVSVFKKKKSVLWGKPTVYHTKSADRVEPFCEHFGVCGGCKWQNLDYAAQLRHKEQNVRDAFDRIAKVPVAEFLPILGAPTIKNYRNKLEFGCSSRRWLTQEEVNDESISIFKDVIGFHRAGAYDKIIQIDECFLQHGPSNELRNGIHEIATNQGIKFFDMRENHGLLRQLMVRTTSTGEVMLVIAFYENDQDKIKPFLDAVIEKFPAITSLFYVINSKLNEYLMDLEMQLYHGPGYVEEELAHIRYRIGPKSFFQTNSAQAVNLFKETAAFADLQGHENVYDLYTGIGSIALFLAKDCKQVVGIEEISAAIDDARVNASINNIENTVFYAGDVKDMLTTAFTEKHGKADVLITDPPRAGMHPKVIQMLLQMEVPKLVYVSCNPATHARDIQLLHEKYDLIKMRPIDMFPHTSHVENIALLQLR